MIKLWDTETGDIIHTFKGHKEGINDIAWSFDGEFLASASDDKSIIIWSLETVSLSWRQCSLCLLYQREAAKTLNGHTNVVFCLCFSPHSNMLVSGGYDESVIIWDIARGVI